MVTALLAKSTVDWHSLVGRLMMYAFGSELKKVSLDEPPVTVIGAQFM